MANIRLEGCSDDLTFLERTRLYNKVVAKAWADEKFKAELMKNPRGVFEEMGLKVPAELDVKVHENTDKTLFFPLEDNPVNIGFEGVSGEELAAAGTFGTAGSLGTAGTACGTWGTAACIGTAGSYSL